MTGQQLQDAIAELKASTEVTMETVGIRCNRRVITSLYKEGLKRINGPVVVQPPSEDRVSVFVSLVGGRQVCLKIFSTGKVRCLKSDFGTKEDGEKYAQAVIDRMAVTCYSGMPPIRLSDAKRMTSVEQFHANAKDFTWSTRQAIDIQRLTTALQNAGFRTESDTSFGDSVMVIISPPDSTRSIKGQVLGDGTIRLAGCRGDAEGAARCVIQSLNDTGCLLGGNVDLDAISCEVWLTKRHFQVCSADHVIDMKALNRILLEEADGSRCEQPAMKAWISARGREEYVRSIRVVGTACPRAEFKFVPVVVDAWEQVKRKPEPVSISIHHRGEVHLAGNAEYKVLQACWFIRDLIKRHADAVLSPATATAAAAKRDAAASCKATKRKLDAVRRGESDLAVDIEPRSLSFTPQRQPAPPSPSSTTGSLSPGSAPLSAVSQLPPADFGEEPSPTGRPVSEGVGGGGRVLFDNSPSLDHPLFYGQALPRNAAEIALPPSSSAYHAQQMICLAVLRALCQRELDSAGQAQPVAVKDEDEGAGSEPPRSPQGETAGMTGRVTPISPKRRRTAVTAPVTSPSQLVRRKDAVMGPERGGSILSVPVGEV